MSVNNNWLSIGGEEGAVKNSEIIKKCSHPARSGVACVRRGLAASSAFPLKCLARTSSARSVSRAFVSYPFSWLSYRSSLSSS